MRHGWHGGAANTIPVPFAKDRPVSDIVTAMQNVIQISNLSKSYASGFKALKSINLEIRRGEIFALLGPNGAGKTSTVEILEGLRPRTAGDVVAVLDPGGAAR